MKLAFVFFGVVLCFSIASAIVVIPANKLPYWQAFDSWDQCFYDGVCYEKQCTAFRGGFFNPTFQESLPGPEIRHWWIIAGQTPSNWDSNRQPVACSSVVTGPCYDRTKGDLTGKYMYAESSACFGVQFHVITPTFEFTNTSASISFAFYFFGANLAQSPQARIEVDVSANNGSSWSLLTSIVAGTGIGAVKTSSTQPWTVFTSPTSGSGSIYNVLGVPTPSESSPLYVVFRFRATTASPNNNAWRGDIAIDDIIVTQDGAPGNLTPWIDYNCSALGLCNPIPPETTSGGGIIEVTGGGGDGLSDDEIIGIVVGIVGGAALLCCCLFLLLLLLLLIISPRKPPSGGGGLD